MENKIEALLFALGRPLSRVELQKMLGASAGEVNQALKNLSDRQNGIVLVDDGNEVELRTKGRHDPCVGIRAVPVGEAMMACVLADHLLLHRALTAQS